jgi:hypothetical protein
MVSIILNVLGLGARAKMVTNIKIIGYEVGLGSLLNPL